MKSLVALVLIFSMLQMEAYRLPGLGQFRKGEKYPTFEVANFVSYVRNLFIAPDVNPRNDSKIEGNFW